MIVALPGLCSYLFSVLLALRLPRLGKRELILVLFVRLFDLCLFGFVGFLFLFVSGKGLRFVIVTLPALFSFLFFLHRGAVLNGHSTVQCGRCEMWINTECSFISDTEYGTLVNSNCSWICPKCEVLNFSDSFCSDLIELENQNTFVKGQKGR